MIGLGKETMEQTEKLIADLQRLGSYSNDPNATEVIRQTVDELEGIRHGIGAMLQVYDVLESILFPSHERPHDTIPYNVQLTRPNLN